MRGTLLLVLCAACTAPRAVDVRSPGGPAGSTAPTGGTGPTAPDPGTVPGTVPGTSPQTGDDCPSGVICVDALPFVHQGSTAGGDRALDGYSCSPSTDESGPEVAYRVTLAEDGLLVAGLAGLPAGVDVDVHLLEQLDAGDCVDRGHWDAAALLPAGTWWVVVDSWVDTMGVSHEGDYTLSLAATGAADHVADGLPEETLDAALWAFDQAWQAGETERLEYAVLDFSRPSTEPRLFVLDLLGGGLSFAELASHGSGSQDPNDLTRASHFSNVSGSNASSLGLARAAETYWGSNGYSLRLDGLDPGFNDNVRDRAIVIHAADYATQAFVDDYGYLGRSQGCPAVDPAVHEDLIDTLTGGALLFSYYPDPAFVAGSDWLQGF